MNNDNRDKATPVSANEAVAAEYQYRFWNDEMTPQGWSAWQPISKADYEANVLSPMEGRQVRALYEHASGEGQQGESFDEMLSAPEPVISERVLAELLPHTYYLDPPDGGNVSILEQLRRQAEDAEKWRKATQQQAGQAVAPSFYLKRFDAEYIEKSDFNQCQAILYKSAPAGNSVAYYTTPQTPDGMVLVPRELTDEMTKAITLHLSRLAHDDEEDLEPGSDAFWRNIGCADMIYRDLIAASEASG